MIAQNTLTSLSVNNQTGGGNSRVDYIDLLKGFTILWIIWFHADCFDFVHSPACNAIFFFISGVFIKTTPLHNFTLKRINRIIIPFIFAYLLSYPFRMIVHYWDYHTLSTFDFGSIWHLFNSEARHDYLSLNVPLWFLLCLIVIHFIYYAIHKLPQPALLCLAIAAIIGKNIILSIPTPVMLNNALFWISYFLLGATLGRAFITRVIHWQPRIIITCICLISFLILEYIICPQIDTYIYELKVICVVFFFLSFASLFNGIKRLDFLRFYGTNSLSVVMFHIMILIPIERIIHKFYPEENPWLGLAAAVIVAIVLIPVINRFNRYAPYLVGKSDLIKSKTKA